MFTYRSLENIPMKILSDCFNNAFQDYYIKMKLSEDELLMYFKSSSVDLKYSFGAFKEQEMIGFIFNSTNNYQGKKVVFDAGTGVIPKYRGMKVFTNLFLYTEKELKKNKIDAYYLEVLQQNQKAIDSYKKQGFKIVREFLVLKVSKDITYSSNILVDTIPFREFDFKQIKELTIVAPSYENSIEILKTNPDMYEVMVLNNSNSIDSFCIYSKHNGGINQIGFKQLSDLKIIIINLLIKFPKCFIKNVDTKYKEVIDLLTFLGFVEFVKQFEMEKDF